MPALSVNVLELLSKLPDDSFERIKSKLKENREQFVNPKDHPMAGPLFQVMLDDKVMPVMDRDILARTVQSVIPRDILEVRWLGKYCDLLLRALGNVQQNAAGDERAVKYAGHLIGKMIPDFKKHIQSTTEAAAFPDELGFIFKISACLFRCTSHRECPFTLTVDRAVMMELEEKTATLSGNLFGSYRNEERAYVRLICWVLEEMLCEQDGIEEE